MLQGLLLRGVGVADVDDIIITARLDWLVVELGDDCGTSGAILEAKRISSAESYLDNVFSTSTDRAKPTPRPMPFLSRKILAEQTLCGAKREASSFTALASPDWRVSKVWTHMFVHRLWQVRNVEVGVVIIGECLELGVE